MKIPFGKYGTRARCPECHYIDESIHLEILSNSCRNCGASDMSREMWPHPTTWKLLEWIERRDFDENDELSISIVFSCIVIELVMEDMLWHILSIKKTRYEVCEALFRSNRPVEKRIKLFQRLVGKSIKELLQEDGSGDWFESWKGLINLRNNMVHSGEMVWYAGERERNLLETVLHSFLDKFQYLNNCVVELSKTSQVK